MGIKVLFTFNFQIFMDISVTFQILTFISSEKTNFYKNICRSEPIQTQLYMIFFIDVIVSITIYHNCIQ